MCQCCGNHPKSEETNRMNSGEKPPKSFIGKLLYIIGKKENEKENQNKKMNQ